MAKCSAQKFYIKKLFGMTNIIRSSDKEKNLYSDYEIAFNEKGEWSFGNDYARYITIFSVDSDSSSRPNNPKNIF